MYLSASELELVNSNVKTTKNFPRKGITFFDVTGILQNPVATKILLRYWKELLNGVEFDVVAGLESRGFHFGILLANAFEKPFIQIRKPGKIANPIKVEYTTEYSSGVIEIDGDLKLAGKRVVIVDDLYATGGTINASIQLLNKIRCVPVAASCVLKIDVANNPNKDIQYFHLFNVDNNKLVVTNSKLVYVPVKEETLEKNIIMYHPTMKELADTYSKKFNLVERYIEWKKFDNNWWDIHFYPFLENTNVTFIMNCSNPEYFLEQLITLIVLPRQIINSLTVIVPYFGCGTHERVRYEGMLATAEPIMKLLSSIPMTMTGPAIFEFYDIHALQERFYVTDNIRIKLKTAIPLFIDMIKDEKPVIAFPDDGAYKRFSQLFVDFPVLVCSKIRDGDKRHIKITDKYRIPKNYSDVIIVDDIVLSGGTLIECQKALKEYGFKNVSCYVTHSVFPLNSYEKFKPDDFKAFYTTNTNPEVTVKLKSNPLFKVIPLFGEYNDDTRKIIVATTNKDKLQAVKKVFKKKHVYGISGIPSRVPEQPIGNDQTRQGAINRAKNAQEAYSDDAIFIGIESGIIKQQGSYYDITYIHVIDGWVNTTWSTELTKIPKEHDELVMKCIENQDNVYGKIIEKEQGIPEGQWQKFYGKKSRQELITQVFDGVL